MNPVERSSFIRGMTAAGQLAARALAHVSSYAKEGRSTGELDAIAYDYIRTNGGIPAPLNYRGFPKSICTSVNRIIVHGVPDDKDILRAGDKLALDVSVKLKGFFGDTCTTFIIGGADTEIIEAARRSRDAGISVIAPNKSVSHIGAASKEVHNFEVVTEVGGHGIGRAFHLQPFVPAYDNRNTFKLLPWTCITVEPILVERADYETSPIKNSDILLLTGAPSAQFEHTVLVTDSGYDILTNQ